MEPYRKVTLRDVAERAGVSTSTVSRVLDERLPSSNSPAAQRVREIARELGYTRDALASSLRRQGTSTVGVIVPRLSDSVMANFYEAVAAECEGRGVFAVVATTQDREDRDQVAIDRLLSRRVDGLILTTARLDVDTTHSLRRMGVPHVLALRTDGRSASAVGDDRLGGYIATRHLLDLGHRRIGLAVGPTWASSSVERRAGYEEALRSAGLEPDPALVAGDGYGADNGERAAIELLGRPDPPTAIFAVNDDNAFGMLAAANRLGLRVPDDLSIVGYNDIELVSRLPVPLTSVRVPFDRIAEDAVGLLLRDQQDVVVRVSQPTLIPRASSAPPRAGR